MGALLFVVQKNIEHCFFMENSGSGVVRTAEGSASPLAPVKTQLRSRARAASWHLLVSLGVCALSGALVFGLWYPGPYRLMSGGRDLVLLVALVDVVLGPLLTFIVFDPRKASMQLCRDLSVIAALQMAGLAYGLHTVYFSRPVALAFEVDRFRMVSAAEVHTAELPRAAPEFRTLPLTGPRVLAVRPAEAGNERNEAIFMALRGIDTGQRPSFWIPYDQSKSLARAKSKPLSALLLRYPAQRNAIESAIREAGQDTGSITFLPVLARGDWVAFLDSSGNIVGFFPIDGFL